MMSEIQADSAASDAAGQYSSIGNTLRAAREALGLSTQEISDRIKFSVRQVDALERGNTEHLPQRTFLRGFIRSYAHIVNIDPAPLLAGIDTHSEHHFDVADVQAGGDLLPVAGGSGHKNLYVLLGALIIAIGLAWFLFDQRNEDQRLMIGDNSSRAQPEPVTGTVSGVIASTANIGAGENSLPATHDVKTSAAGLQVEELPKAVTSTEIPSDKREIPREQLMKRPIHIVFQDDAWVEIKDVNGEVLISRITQAGEEKWIGGGRRAPYQVTIGRVGAVRLFYKGDEVDLSGFKSDGFARLVLE